MKRMALILGLVGAFSVEAAAHESACPAAGVDGAKVAASASTTEVAGKISSNSQEGYAHWLCCNTGVAACTDFDTAAKSGGGADRYVFSLEDTAGCSAVDVDVGFKETATGVNHTIGTITLTTDSFVVSGPRGRFATATVNVATGCTTGIDLRIDTFHNRGNLTP